MGGELLLVPLLHGGRGLCGSSKWREGDQVEERKKDVHVVVGEREKRGLLFPACKRRREIDGVKGVVKGIIGRCV